MSNQHCGCSCGGDPETGYEHNMNCKGFWPPAYIEKRKQLRAGPPEANPDLLRQQLVTARAYGSAMHYHAVRLEKQLAGVGALLPRLLDHMTWGALKGALLEDSDIKAAIEMARIKAEAPK